VIKVLVIVARSHFFGVAGIGFVDGVVVIGRVIWPDDGQ